MISDSRICRAGWFGIMVVAVFAQWTTTAAVFAEEAKDAAPSASLIRHDHAETVVCLGDSVTGVYYHTGGQRAYPEMLELAIATALPDSKVKVINAGISGNTTADGLARLDKDVLQHHPTIVTISFGLNDMVRVPEDQFRKNLETLVARCREAGSQVVLCTPNMVITTTPRPIEKLKKYCDIIRQTGRELGVPVCDQFAAGEAYLVKDPWAWRLTLSDEIHPNMDGHKLMAEELCRTLTGHSVSLADAPPLPNPLAKTEALWKASQPVKVLAMPPYDALIGPALEKNYPGIKVEVTPWPVEGKTLPELETIANQTVRAMRPNLVVLAVPRSASAESDEQFVKSYSWVMNWSLSFGQTEWDCIVLHPAVASPTESAPRDDLMRKLVKAQDLHLIDRVAGDESSAADLLSRWIEKHRAAK
ncbi:MAG: GDSL-type esterase/lipase family protein [Planctomycetaceae bacterium]